MIREITLRSITDRRDRGCIDVDASVFYPRQRTRGAVDYARQFCDRCPVTDACRTYASAHDLDGIWGGTTEAERRVVMNSHRLALVSTDPRRSGRPSVPKPVVRGTPII